MTVYYADTDYQPTATKTETYYWPVATNKISNLLAATSWFIRHNYYPAADGTGIRVVQDHCTSTNEEFSCSVGNMAYIKLEDRNSKFRTDEVFGMAWLDEVLNGGSDPNFDFSFSNNNFPQYNTDDNGGKAFDLTSDRYDSSVAYYGFGLYTAALTFNNITHTDCDYYYDFHWDLGQDGWDPPGSLDCETGNSYCEANCRNNIPFKGHGVALDWLRFLWDMAKSSPYGYSFESLADVYKNSTPTTWPNETTYGNFMITMSTAAYVTGSTLGEDYLGANWGTCAGNNGVLH